MFELIALGIAALVAKPLLDKPKEESPKPDRVTVITTVSQTVIEEYKK